MKRIALIATFSFLLLAGCNKSGLQSNLSQVDIVPQTFENPTSIPDRPLNLPEIDTANPVNSQTEDKPTRTTEKPKDSSKPKPSDQPKKPTETSTKPAGPQASQFIKNAEMIMIKEGKKIGTPCNFYLSRVLEVSGFSKAPFVANDFDLYAKKYFSHYRNVDFVNDAAGSDKARLKQHIWSYPERTPFIMQWSRTGFYGHVAIVERIGEQLIVYQASLNSHSARRDQTTVDILLNGVNRRLLTVYSEFTK